jgi:hypothetical protein
MKAQRLGSHPQAGAPGGVFDPRGLPVVSVCFRSQGGLWAGCHGSRETYQIFTRLPRKLKTRLSLILFAISGRMPDKDSQYKKVVFKEDRVPKGRSLAVIIEILQTAKRNRTDVSDLAMIEFAYKLLENRIMNEEWGHCDKSAKSISFRSLPPLGEPTRKEGDLIAWVVEEATF